MMNSEIIDEKLLDIIDKNNYLWEDRLSKQRVMMWLNNFSGNRFTSSIEKDIAFDLLNNFLYYGEKEIRYLCKASLSILKNIIIRGNITILNETNMDLLFNMFLEKCIFSYVGRASESGGLILYYFRQENNIPIGQFIDPSLISSDNILEYLLYDSVLVFVDDFLGTGETACTFWSMHIEDIIEDNPDDKIYYLANSFDLSYLF